MTEIARTIEDFGSRTEYREYTNQLATSALLAYGVVFDGHSYGRVQSWTEENFNLSQDDMQTARTEARNTGRFIYEGRIVGWKLTPGALPATADEQRVIDTVQKLAKGVNGILEDVQDDIAALRVPNVPSNVSREWDNQTAEFFRERDRAYQARQL